MTTHHPGPAPPSRPQATWRDVPVIGFAAAAALAVQFCLVWLLRDGLTTDYTWGLLLTPVLMGVAGAAVMVLWARLLTRVPRLVATLGVTFALLVFAVAVGWWLVEVNAATHLFTGSTFWLLALAPVCAGLAWLADRVLPEPHRSPAEPPTARDDAWSRVGAARRRAWGVTAFAALILGVRIPDMVAGERPRVWDIPYLLVAALVALLEWRGYRSARRRAAQRGL